MLAAALLAGGCASISMPAPAATAATVEKMRSAGLSRRQVGPFTLAPGKPETMDQAVGLRGGNRMSAAKGSFALQLRETLLAELEAAGLHDTASGTVIEGQLTDSQLDPAIGTGTGRLAARFMVKRGGATPFDKELAVESSWESSFIGAIAIPLAVNQYTGLYKSLIAKLLDDGDFRAALSQ